MASRWLSRVSFGSLGRLLDLWDRVRTSYWFLPGTLVVGALVLALAMVEVDERMDTAALGDLAWVYRSSAEGARTVLGTVAGSMVGIAGVVFSITIVALSIAATQFGPHLLRNFMAKRTTQVALGTFLASFVYPLLVLRTVQGRDGDAMFVPTLSVLVAVLFALASIAVLIHFLHHIATSIQVAHIATDVVRDLRRHLELFFEKEGRPCSGPDPRLELSGSPRALRAERSGYVRLIERDLLVRLACEHDLRIFVRRNPGTLVLDGTVLAEVGPAERVDDEVLGKLRAGFVVGEQRTPIQDVSYSIDQLVEIAERALSPGVNDPATAVYCIHGLANGLGGVVRRPEASGILRDEDGEARVSVQPVRFVDLVSDAFDRILACAGPLRQVYSALLEALALLAEIGTDPERRAFMLGYAEKVRSVAHGRLDLAHERARIDAAIESVTTALQTPRGP